MQRRSGLSQRGFSLVELAVAVLLGAIVVGGLINLFISNRKAYQVQSGNNFLQENLRIATDRIGWSVRMADFWGGNRFNTVTTNSGTTVTAKGNCNGAWATLVDATQTGGGGVYGYDGGTAFPIDAPCIDGDANYVKGSDVLVLRYADSTELSPGPADATTPAEASTIKNNAKETFLLSTPGVAGQLFAGTVPTTSTAKLQRYAYPYQVEVYYLRPCSVIASGTTCKATDDNGLPLPTLMRMHLNADGTFASDAIVTGIEQIKFEYGVQDTGATAPTYKAASSVAATEWPNVTSVRISMVAVNPTRNLGIPNVGTFTAASCVYKINNGSTDVSKCTNFTPYGDKPWQFTRARLQQVAQVRNRVRG
ncbi:MULTISPECIES: PilW family protein [Dyella]|uniref:Prepilin-type N-terminal cleavage/methylation domain-containing protein n=2 Tax=Dyella TaxID=231454 RepID=A0A4R0YZZ7_9GAMM|nr:MULTISPECIES: PilW family protein [Dyella]TBR40003.1 prepilin-type N-terminal cleavage/methylation domain-containing protein [Dyella terrae]TCI12416.1 prepilin-type N-terminal cleavage/methylation domain-containing protein [Dyella soli]